ncbi:MAG: UDP-N-acetylglucosamine--N-acetylmuramyl-(pentapeptide) pyrophosphoryl-undecaprenol N-acetylglucosamine transferase [Candidatus Omnitrophica bacterium]|nr:UDP-N-acetylglucosamine--N-acetylmuramyl-(pentapeptide) pyrophosphoryl-undecaprenol N-acetylglucosamine transferase [Candidatus Omnitrophota bacterium]MCF7893591.1 UDP-N-acetylglucosamine--N-acetylmuramyl-(pentapeptide) pyrophosphoryl-undecaprenol N-acetylglucosamine transferase [Candidatus Omnitrophota bacterium]
MKILLVTERSAGHVYPALAIGEKIREKNLGKNIIFFFTSSKFFKKYIKNKGYPVLGLTFRFRNILVDLFCRFIESIYILVKVSPDKVIGFGGRDSLFLVLFSYMLGKETYIYEPNAEMGKSNRLISRFIKNVLRGIPPFEKKQNHKIIGIPLGKNIVKKGKEELKEKFNFNHKPVVFCFGGSQGSQFINDSFFSFVEKYNNGSYQIVHITGKKDYFRMVDFYKKIKNNKVVKDFYQDMSDFYNLADLILSRAGALTLAEISFYNIPAILIPHPKAFGHQKTNANYLGDKGGAVVFEQNNFDSKKFEFYLNKLIQDGRTRQKMKNNLKDITIGVNYEKFSFNYIS